MSVKLHLNFNDLLIKLVLISPIAMLLQRKVDFVNKVVAGGILIVIVLCFIRQGIQRKTFELLTVALIVFGYSLLNINGRYFTANMLVYYPLWFFYLLYTGENYEIMKNSWLRNERFMRIVIWIWSIAVIISFALPNSYKNGQFQSFSNGNFRFAPTVFFMGTLIWAYSGLFNRRKYMVFMVVPFASMIATGCRTYTIIFLIMMILAFYNFFERKSTFWILLMPCVYLVTMVMSGSAFVIKFQTAAENQYVSDSLAALTSNRSVFWTEELRMFANAGIIEKLLGGGLTSSYLKNVSISGQAIWAHNDFLEMLNAHGIVGICLYFECFFKTYGNLKYAVNFSKVQGSVLIACCMLNAFFNGLYVYTTAMLSIPLLAYAVSVDFAEIRQKEVRSERGQ